jgi:hypothetical protein
MGRALLILALALLALPAAAGAAPYTAPAGKVLWGGQGGYSAGHIQDFGRQSGKAPAVYNYFISWSTQDPELRWLRGRVEDALGLGASPMLSISTEGTGLSPRDLARGGGDRFLVALTRLLAEYDRPAYLRPLSEMNNGNNVYAPYDLSGRSRGPAFSTTRFRDAWRRTAIIVRGGAVGDMNARLRRLGMPPVRTGDAALPRPRVALMWVPLSFGNPEIPRNHPVHFWPGARHVDWVGTTWYSPYRASSAMHSFYSHPAWDDKPFAFAEWGVWGAESPSFVGQFFGFLRSHARVRMAVYYQSGTMKPEFRLSSHPASRAALRRAVRWPRLAGASL